MSGVGDSPMTESNCQEMLSQLRNMRVSDLKDLCRSFNISVSGKKQDLFKRIQTVIENAQVINDDVALKAIRILVLKRLQNDSLVPFAVLYNALRSGRVDFLRLLSQANNHITGPSIENTAYPPQATRSVSVPNYRGHPANIRQTNAGISQTLAKEFAMYFKLSPFYVLKRLVPPSPQYARGTDGTKADIRLKFEVEDDTAKAYPNHRYYILCGKVNPDVAVQTESNLEYPLKMEFRVNNVIVKEATGARGIKNEPGSAKPIDITPYIKFNSANTAHLTFVQADAFLLYCYTVEKVTVETIVEKSSLMVQKFDFTVNQIKEEAAKTYDDDIIVDSVSISLKDPLTYTKIKTPVKSYKCNHLQCFDFATFLYLQEQQPTWKCPVCSTKIRLNDLAKSDYFDDVLSRTPDDVEYVILNPDGTWSLPKEEATHRDTSRKPTKSPSEPETQVLPTKKTEDKIEEVIVLDSDEDEEEEQDIRPPVPHVVNRAAPTIAEDDDLEPQGGSSTLSVTQPQPALPDESHKRSPPSVSNERSAPVTEPPQLPVQAGVPVSIEPSGRSPKQPPAFSSAQVSSGHPHIANRTRTATSTATPTRFTIPATTGHVPGPIILPHPDPSQPHSAGPTSETMLDPQAAFMRHPGDNPQSSLSSANDLEADSIPLAFLTRKSSRNNLPMLKSDGPPAKRSQSNGILDGAGPNSTSDLAWGETKQGYGPQVRFGHPPMRPNRTQASGMPLFGGRTASHHYSPLQGLSHSIPTQLPGLNLTRSKEVQRQYARPVAGFDGNEYGNPVFLDHINEPSTEQGNYRSQATEHGTARSPYGQTASLAPLTTIHDNHRTSAFGSRTRGTSTAAQHAHTAIVGQIHGPTSRHSIHPQQASNFSSNNGYVLSGQQEYNDKNTAVGAWTQTIGGQGNTPSYHQKENQYSQGTIQHRHPRQDVAAQSALAEMRPAISKAQASSSEPSNRATYKSPVTARESLRPISVHSLVDGDEDSQVSSNNVDRTNERFSNMRSSNQIVEQREALPEPTSRKSPTVIELLASPPQASHDVSADLTLQSPQAQDESDVNPSVTSFIENSKIDSDRFPTPPPPPLPPPPAAKIVVTGAPPPPAATERAIPVIPPAPERARTRTHPVPPTTEKVNSRTPPPPPVPPPPQSTQKPRGNSYVGDTENGLNGVNGVNGANGLNELTLPKGHKANGPTEPGSNELNGSGANGPNGLSPSERPNIPKPVQSHPRDAHTSHETNSGEPEALEDRASGPSVEAKSANGERPKFPRSSRAFNLNIALYPALDGPAPTGTAPQKRDREETAVQAESYKIQKTPEASRTTTEQAFGRTPISSKSMSGAHKPLPKIPSKSTHHEDPQTGGTTSKKTEVVGLLGMVLNEEIINPSVSPISGRIYNLSLNTQTPRRTNYSG